MNKRLNCSQCLRPQTLCHCHLIERISSDLPIVILQHPDEQNHPFNTARIVRDSIIQSTLLTGTQWSLSEGALSEAMPKRAWPFLLYTGEPIVSVSGIKSEINEHGGTPVAIILDGTWRNTREILLSSPQLQSVPRVALLLPKTSTYAIRKSNVQGGLATIEAAYHLLTQWHENEQYQGLLTPFEYMVAQQRQFVPS
nr:tRNA-uridine aminocarboxypropyltransferase [Echinimonas agarilytica]